MPTSSVGIRRSSNGRGSARREMSSGRTTSPVTTTNSATPSDSLDVRLQRSAGVEPAQQKHPRNADGIDPSISQVTSPR